MRRNDARDKIFSCHRNVTDFSSEFISLTPEKICIVLIVYIGWYVVSEKWHNFWEPLKPNLLGLFDVAGKSTIFPRLHTNRY